MALGNRSREGRGRTTKEYRAGQNLVLHDVDQEVALTLIGLGHEFERWEAVGLVTYAVRHGGTELGRLVIAPPSNVFAHVRVRQFDPASGPSREVEALCADVHHALEALSSAAEQKGSADDTRYSYPRARRRAIVDEYRTALLNGEVENKENWAQRHHISRKTLWRYECEFPES